MLDGGLATELEARGHDLNHALWSARLLDDDPDAIRAVHAAYVAAGAEIVITASYQAPAEPAARLARSVDLARASGARFVAASIGPYGAALADGSEYTGDYGDVDLRTWHEPRLRFLESCDIDLLACETIPCLAEAEALADLVEKPAWFAFTCRDGTTLRDGTPIADAVRAVESKAIAVGINCTDPQHVAPLLDAIDTELPLVAYPNSGETYDPVTKTWSGRSAFLDHVPAWIDRGVRIVGGCCRVGPIEIAELTTRIRR